MPKVSLRKSDKSKTGGLSASGRKRINRLTGSNLKPPVSAKQAKKSPKAAGRRKSFCARSSGIAKKFPSAAKDPNSRLSKARRRWDC